MAMGTSLGMVRSLGNISAQEQNFIPLRYLSGKKEIRSTPHVLLAMLSLIPGLQ
jgi:hypothetical protein